MMKDCINPVAYWQCISQQAGKCLHSGPCEPVDHEGNRYSMVAFKDEGNKTICYVKTLPRQINAPVQIMKATIKKIAPVVDAEELQRKNAATKGRFAKPSPHPYMDPIIDRAKFQNESIEKICDQCPECGECTLAKEPEAIEHCGKIRRILV